MRMTAQKKADIEAYTLEKFKRWWDEEGSGMRPLPDEDTEAHVHRISQIAWWNGAYCDDRRLRDTINDIMDCDDSDWVTFSIGWRTPLLLAAALGWLAWWAL